VAKHVTFCTWDDAPHLSEAQKKKMAADLPPHQRDARTKGIPALGSGAIYPVEESFIKVGWDEIPGRRIPDHWPRRYAMDVGWNWTAATWRARNPDTGISYIYHCYKRGQAEPSTHAAAILALGQWIPGVIDPAAQGRSQEDGSRLIESYKALGLDIEAAPHAVESGIYDVFNMLSTGMLKVLDTCRPWFEEYRIYRRDKNGRVVKENDHLMDPTRYDILAGIDGMKAVPVAELNPFGNSLAFNEADYASNWMGR
jgi:hypothetical protein